MTNSSDSNEGILKDIAESQRFEREFLGKRKVFLWGAVGDESAKHVVDRLLYLESQKQNEEITLYISSPGGVVTSGMIIYDTMNLISSPVRTVCIGLAASMGSIILSGGEKGKRTIWPHGKVMIHQPSIGQLFGPASDIQIHAEQIEKTRRLSAEILAKNCGHDTDKILADFDRDFWMDAQESLDYGVVDLVSDKTDF